VYIDVEVKCHCPEFKDSEPLAIPTVFLTNPGKDAEPHELDKGGGKITLKAVANATVAVECGGEDDGKEDCVVTTTTIPLKKYL